MFTLDGKNVAGFGPQQSPDMPPYWTVYITVENSDAAVASAVANGGTVVVDSMDVLDAGRMAVLQDAVGSFISVWQPYQHIGSQLVNEPGTFAWNELAANDLAKATAFYRSVFGWGLEANASSEQSSIFTVGGAVTCGAHVAGEGDHPAWSVWFAVADCDASAAKVKELGGSVFVEPDDMGFGRGAIVADPSGAVFGIGVMNENPDT